MCRAWGPGTKSDVMSVMAPPSRARLRNHRASHRSAGDAVFGRHEEVANQDGCGDDQQSGSENQEQYEQDEVLLGTALHRPIPPHTSRLREKFRKESYTLLGLDEHAVAGGTPARLRWSSCPACGRASWRPVRGSS